MVLKTKRLQKHYIWKTKTQILETQKTTLNNENRPGLLLQT